MKKPVRGSIVRRNDPCPCGSGKKHKKCCMWMNTRARPEHHPDNMRIRLKSAANVENISSTGKLVIETLDLVEDHIKPGITTELVNTLVHDFLLSHETTPALLNYRGFPKSVCVSVNEEVCHGIPGDRVLKEGDIVNVDPASIFNGFYADASKTFFVGTPGADAQKIVNVTRQCLMRGMAVVKPGNTIGDIGFAIQSFAESQGCSVVREFVGHGVGFDLQEPPQIPHYGTPGTGLRLVPGMVFIVEPMINLGGHELIVLEDQWTAITRDRSLSAQFGQTILVTSDGFESLTPYPL